MPDVLNGLNGVLALEEDCAVSRRQGQLATVFHAPGERRIPYARIQQVVFLPGGLLNGYLCLVEAGAPRPANRMAALKHPNAVMFRFPQNAQAARLARLAQARLPR